MELSQLKIYSLGIVAANKKLSTRDIEVTPVEDLPMSSGELTDNAVPCKAAAADQAGNAYSVEVTSSATVKATWLPMCGSNRMSAPDVRRGETVALYRFGDTDRFWWTTLRDDMYLRKLETVIYAFSATKDENATNDASNMYFLEISTHNKLVHFHTSNANGEPFVYDIQINTGEGYISIQDDTGNYFLFNSKERQLEMVNIDGSKVEINKTLANIFTNDSVNLKTATFNIDAHINHTGGTNATEDYVIGGISSMHHSHPDPQGGSVGEPQ